MSFDIKCPHCGSELEAEDDMIGMSLECPSCSNEFQVVKPPKPTRDCPYCGEEILLKAKKCKHCGEFLDPKLRPKPMPPPPPLPIPQKTTVLNRNRGCADIIIFGPLIIGIILFFGLLFRGCSH